MTPGARAAAAMALVDGFFAPGETRMLDAVLSDWARKNRYAGSKDRAAVADLAYAALRRAGSAPAAFGAPFGDARAATLGALALEIGAAPDEIAALSEAAYGPPPLSAAETRILGGLAAAGPAPDGRADWPAAFWPELARSAGSDAAAEAEAAALSRRAAFDLRVNLLKGDPAEATMRLAQDGLQAHPAPLSPIGLRIAVGAAARPKLSRVAAYAEGLIEPQDAASQAAALLLTPRVGELAVDLCAGAGGKSLALAAARGPGARPPILAFDVDARRLAPMPDRLARAGAERLVRRVDRAGLARAMGEADAVLVDAPCSGSGAWARQPDAKWRLTPARLAALTRAQDEAIDLGAQLLKPGGRLLYATCSLFRAENEDRVAAALARHGALVEGDLGAAWRACGLLGPPPEGASRRFSPAADAVDGFFVALLRRR